VPSGFRIQKFAENLGNVRILAIGPNGDVYVTRREEGDILMFHVGADGLAAAESVRVASKTRLRFLSVCEGGLGLAFLGLVVGYLPTRYQSFAKQEMIISLLDLTACSVVPLPTNGS